MLRAFFYDNHFVYYYSVKFFKKQQQHFHIKNPFHIGLLKGLLIPPFLVFCGNKTPFSVNFQYYNIINMVTVHRICILTNIRVRLCSVTWLSMFFILKYICNVKVFYCIYMSFKIFHFKNSNAGYSPYWEFYFRFIITVQDGQWCWK